MAIVPATGPECTVRTGAWRASVLVIAPPATSQLDRALKAALPRAVLDPVDLFVYISGPMQEFITAVVVRSYRLFGSTGPSCTR